MPREILRLGVLALRRPPVTRWSTGEIRPLQVLPGEPGTPPGTLIASGQGGETWYVGARDMVMFSGDASHLRDNLASGRPSVWVALRGQDPAQAEIVALTVDPYEGEGFASDPDLIVDAVPMPEAVSQAVAAFAEAHYVELPFKKRKRQNVDTENLRARAPRILPEDEKWETTRGRGKRP